MRVQYGFLKKKNMSGVSQYNAIVEQDTLTYTKFNEGYTVYVVRHGKSATYTEGTPGPISIRQLGASAVFEG